MDKEISSAFMRKAKDQRESYQNSCPLISYYLIGLMPNACL